MAKEKYFRVEIKLSNDAMRETHHVTCALQKVVEQLKEREDWANAMGTVEHPTYLRRIFDTNGNTVGTWRFSEEDEEHGA